MGTRSTTTFINEYDGKPMATCYKQCDGYPSGYGQDLADFLSGKTLVNGFSIGDTIETRFNGMGCLAAAVIAHFKTGIGEYYLTSTGDEQEYNYTVYEKDGKIHLKVVTGDYHDKETLYDGLA